MKDIVITGKRVKIELFTLLACFVIANAVNLYAIISHHTKLIEMLTALGYVLIFTLALYVAWSIIRICFYLIKWAVCKTKGNK